MNWQGEGLKLVEIGFSDSKNVLILFPIFYKLQPHHHHDDGKEEADATAGGRGIFVSMSWDKQ